MHSLLTTLVLAALALPLGYLAAVQMKDENLSRVFGAPPRAEGSLLYQFDPRKATRVNITSDIDGRARFEKQGGIWVMHEPHEDRADFASLQTIAFAAASMRIERAIPLDEADEVEFGFTAGTFLVEVLDDSKNRLAYYLVGRKSALHHLDAEKEQVQETLFIKPLDGSDGHLYVCSGVNIRPVLRPGLASLRDRHPFLFDAARLASVEIARAGSRLELKRQGPGLPWRITKPLELLADPEAVTGLLADLRNLTAVKVSNPDEVTVTTDDTTTPWLEITLREFAPAAGEAGPAVTLTVAPPASEDAATTPATVDNRDGLAVFELPLNTNGPNPGLAQLPLAVNQLRSRTMLARDFLACTAIEIHSARGGAPVFLQRDVNTQTGRFRWRYSAQSGLALANERTMKKLYTAVQFDKVAGFASDAPADLAPFGLAEPDKRLVLHFGPDDKTEFHLGRADDKDTGETRYFAKKADSPTVAEISGGTFAAVEDAGFAWRDSLLWNFSIFDLASLLIRKQDHEDLLIRYDDLIEEWSAVRGEEDVTSLLNAGRARNYIDFLESLEVTRWLGPDQPAAAEALRNPAFSLHIRSRVVSSEGDPLGTRTRILQVAPVSPSPRNRFFYGRVVEDPDFFILDLEAYDRLTLPLLETN